MTNLWIDIDSPGAEGPITSCQSWNSRAGLNQVGSGSFNLPADDPRAGLLRPGVVASAYAAVGSNPRLALGSVLIDQIGVDGGQSPQMRVSGTDLMGELTHRRVSLRSVGGVPPTLDLTTIMNQAPNNWNFVVRGVGTHGPLPTAEIEISGTVMAALVALADRTGDSFRGDGGRTILWIKRGASEVLDLTATPGVVTRDNFCHITSLTRDSDASDLVTRVYPYGAGEGVARITLADTREGVDLLGAEIDRDENYLQVPSPDPLIEREIAFQEVSPLGTLTGSLADASDDLAARAAVYLQTHSRSRESYRLGVQGLERELLPGQSIRVVSPPHWGFELNDVFLVTAVDHRWSTGNAPTTSLEVSLDERLVVGGQPGDTFVNAVSQARELAATPQPRFTVLSLGGACLVDSSVSGFVLVHVPEEIIQVHRATLRWATFRGFAPRASTGNWDVTYDSSASVPDGLILSMDGPSLGAGFDGGTNPSSAARRTLDISYRFTSSPHGPKSIGVSCTSGRGVVQIWLELLVSVQSRL